MANLRANGTKSVKRGRAKRAKQKVIAKGMPTITALAAMLGDAARDMERADEAKFTAREICEATRGSRGKTHQRIAFLALDIERDEESHSDRQEVLEKLLLRLEPHTPEEVFSLALIVGTELDTVLSNFTDHENDPKARKAGQVLSDAFDAILHGMYHHMGLRSPMVGHYYTPERYGDRGRRRREAERLSAMDRRDIEALIAQAKREPAEL